ncbi:MAG: zincin-like metallopeptidase domain-containing protein [Methylococcaceae bacterium]
MKKPVERRDVYAQVTDKIIAELEKGVRPWFKPWNAAHAAGSISRPLRHNGQPYSGINVLMLWIDAMEKGYTAPLWMTFKQALELGGSVNKGEHGSLVVFANTFTKTETDSDSGEETARNIPFMKGYTVFNVEQISGLPAHFYATAEAPQINETQRLEHAERFFTNTGVTINHGGNKAYYSKAGDHIQMPPFVSFKDPESYYSTLAHEICHSTRHPSRLDRDFGQKAFGDEAYALEELCAELGSVFVSVDLGIAPAVLDDHAAYLSSWLTALKNDKRYIFKAAAHAQRAVEFLHSLQTTESKEHAA